jgi:tRNA(Ile)-lysidine synthase
MMMHFFKGTGISGLRGIRPKQGNIIRPLLFAPKTELQAFAETVKLDWVEDSSNASDKYTRNFFRHRVIPLIEEVYPEVKGNLAGNLQRFREAEELYLQALGHRLLKLLEHRGTEVHIPVEKLRRVRPLVTMTLAAIAQFNFSPKQVEEVIALLDSATGKYVQSATHRIIRNRNWLIIAPLTSTIANHVLIGSEGETIFAEGHLRLSLHDAKTIRSLDHGSDVALLDAAKITWPLLLRRWKAGDYFYPLGLRKKKKIARFLIDTKVSLAEKERTWVLESDKKLIWLIGHRIDDRCKVTPSTQRILKIAFTSGKSADALSRR